MSGNIGNFGKDVGKNIEKLADAINITKADGVLPSVEGGVVQGSKKIDLSLSPEAAIGRSAVNNTQKADEVLSQFDPNLVKSVQMSLKEFNQNPQLAKSGIGFEDALLKSGLSAEEALKKGADFRQAFN